MSRPRDLALYDGLLWSLDGGQVDLADWVPARTLWLVRCTARRTNGLPCRCWAVRGAFVCAVHGGRAAQVRQAAQRRLAIANWERAYVRLVRRVAAREAA